YAAAVTPARRSPASHALSYHRSRARSDSRPPSIRTAGRPVAPYLRVRDHAPQPVRAGLPPAEPRYRRAVRALRAPPPHRAPPPPATPRPTPQPPPPAPRRSPSTRQARGRQSDRNFSLPTREIVAMFATDTG